jgi:hypothetical protein
MFIFPNSNDTLYGLSVENDHVDILLIVLAAISCILSIVFCIFECCTR